MASGDEIAIRFALPPESIWLPIKTRHAPPLPINISSGVAYALELAPGAFALTGVALEFSGPYRLALDAGVFALTGADANFLANVLAYTMNAAPGSFLIIALDATMGAAPDPAFADLVVVPGKRLIWPMPYSKPR